MVIGQCLSHSHIQIPTMVLYIESEQRISSIAIKSLQNQRQKALKILTIF